MTKNLSKKNFTILSKAIDKIYISILDDISIKYNINKKDLEKDYPDSYKKKNNNNKK